MPTTCCTSCTPSRSHTAAHAARLANAAVTVSCGDPQRNKNYRAALFGGKKSDPVEAREAARFALTERPTPTPPMEQELRTLRQVASRMQDASDVAWKACLVATHSAFENLQPAHMLG